MPPDHRKPLAEQNRLLERSCPAARSGKSDFEEEWSDPTESRLHRQVAMAAARGHSKRHRCRTGSDRAGSRNPPGSPPPGRESPERCCTWTSSAAEFDHQRPAGTPSRLYRYQGKPGLSRGSPVSCRAENRSPASQDRSSAGLERSSRRELPVGKAPRPDRADLDCRECPLVTAG